MNNGGITLAKTYQIGKQMLNDKKIPDADFDAFYLMEHIFHINKVEYYMNTERLVKESDFNRYISFIEERASNKPLQYIIGKQEFMGLTFYVNEHVLIPRQDTETLVEQVMKVAENKSVLDMCTGTGCIITSLEKLCNLRKAVGVDISTNALEVARKNVESNQANVELLESDLFENVTGKYDIIVSNPPYIKTKEIKELMPEVKNYEPVLALDGMEDGLYFYRKIIKNTSNYLEKNGKLFFEIGYDQGNEVALLLEEAFFSNVQIIKDLAGLDRVIYASI